MTAVKTPPKTSGALLEERGDGLRFRLFRRAATLLEAQVSPGLGWLRVAGRGLLVKDLRTCAPTTGEVLKENGPQYALGPFLFRLLGFSAPPVPTCEAEALFWTFAARHAVELGAFYGRPVVELSHGDVAQFVQAAGYAAELGIMLSEQMQAKMRHAAAAASTEVPA